MKGKCLKRFFTKHTTKTCSTTIMIAVTYFTAYWAEKISSKYVHIWSGDWPYS